MNKKLKTWIFVFLIANLLIFFDSKGYFNWLKRPVGILFNPIQHKLYLNKVTEENLESFQSSQLAIVEAELIKIKQENLKIRELLGTKLSPSWKFTPANILKLENNILTIDVGKLLQIDKNMIVIGIKKSEINNGILIGQVSKVDEMKAEVMLLSHKDSLIQVETESGAEGVLVTKDDELVISEVLQDQYLYQDELVLTQGKDGWLPGLVIGKIAGIEKVDTEIFQSATVNQLVSIDSLKQVFVVRL